MIFSLRTRILIVVLMLAVATIAGAYTAGSVDILTGHIKEGSMPPLLAELADLEIFHILMHVFIFAGMTFVLSSSPRTAWTFALTGAVVMEMAQVLTGVHYSVTAMIWGVIFDLFVDVVSAWFGIWLGGRVAPLFAE